MSSLFPVQVRGALTRRHGKTLVGPLDVELDGRGTLVVIGPNGSGKTTFLRLLHGIARLHAGQIEWACQASQAQQAQAFVFQRPVMLRRSVGDNLAYPLWLKGIPPRAARDRASAWADRVGLGGHLDVPAPALSGGEQQKLALARALITEPELVFLDEPTAALDGRATREIEAMLHAAKDAGTRVILSTHDMGQAKRLADRVLFLYGGHIHEDSDAGAFFENPATLEARAFLNGDIVE